MGYIERIQKRLDEAGGMITSVYCKENNIPTVYLSRLYRDGILNKVAPGVYLTENGDYDEFYIFQYRYKNAIFSYETALYIMGLTDKIVQRMDVTVSRNYKINADFPQVDIHYVKKEIHSLGIIEAKTMFGNIVKVYSYERTLCDFILDKQNMDPETYVKVIRSYSTYEKKDINKLYSIATKMGVSDKVKEIMEVIYE